MITNIKDCATLNNGVKMPWLGFGTFQVPDGEVVERSVLWALEAGYRSIDTAGMYRNEAGVGKAIRESGIPRKEIFVTTKVANERQGFDEALRAFDDSLKLLGMDYVDLYLVHRAVKGKYPETWKAFEKIYKDGGARAIGVSNFLTHHLEDIIPDAEFIPAVNQIEYHPYLTEKELLAFCKKHGIVCEAWSPLQRGKIFEDKTIAAIAENYGRTMAQIALRWNIQNGVITIPRSVKKERIIENAGIFDFALADEDMAAIDALNKDFRISTHPDDY
ncbi:MAG: aldo/keto reductase [Oscillospiraceae bacterium]|nr:aldo/keto reductase [Oscillospiraceae bacterium]